MINFKLWSFYFMFRVDCATRKRDDFCLNRYRVPGVSGVSGTGSMVRTTKPWPLSPLIMNYHLPSLRSIASMYCLIEHWPAEGDEVRLRDGRVGCVTGVTCDMRHIPHIPDFCRDHFEPALCLFNSVEFLDGCHSDHTYHTYHTFSYWLSMRPLTVKVVVLFFNWICEYI